jgi:uncharacterized Fe-S cluster-containing radical SAM superfamily protein
LDIRSTASQGPSAVAIPRPAKFQHPDLTAKGERRASVPLTRLDTLWINTGTLCNITCRNCYIESSPQNDRLVYISAAECTSYLDEIATLRLGTREIAFTGGEPFLNPDMLAMAGDALARGHSILILTNGMQPLQRPKIKQGLLALKAIHGASLTLRVSLDHHTKMLHETERGPKTWDKALAGIDWLSSNGFHVAIAGRTCWGEREDSERAGYAALIRSRGWTIDPADTKQLMLLPEMDGKDDVPEITTACWGILHKQASDMMCATSRMIVKRKGAATPVVVPCTLLPYEADFEMAPTLAASLEADGGMFTNGAVKLCHSNCAKFCVLGGGSCS